MDLKYLFIATRQRVYLVWAVLATAGFVATHFYQKHAINALWTVLAAIGLLYMYRVMPLKVRQMQRIIGVWAGTIIAGMVVSGAVFYIGGAAASQLIGQLGAFWLAVMAVGYALNGLVDRPAAWYWFAAVINVIAAVLCWRVDSFLSQQYLVAAIVTAWSMVNLWLFRD